MITARVEDYLEVIFEIEMEGKLPSVTELAARLGVRKATVAVSVRRMGEEGLLVHQRYGKIALTRKGLESALTTYRRHQQMTFFFSSVLGIDGAVAEEMACSMEHKVTDEADQRLAAFVEFFNAAKVTGAPWLQEFQRAMERPVVLSVPLAMVPAPQRCQVHSIVSHRTERIASLNAMGINTGVMLRRFGGPGDLKIQIEGSETVLALSLEDGVSIWVQPEESLEVLSLLQGLVQDPVQNPDQDPQDH